MTSRCSFISLGNYLYDRLKGVLRGKPARVHLTAIYRDRGDGVVKQFNYSGDAEMLQKLISKPLDLNKFLNG